MSSRRGGLLSNSRRTTALPSRIAASCPSTPAELPEYEPPSCALDETAKRALAEISNNREYTRKYAEHLKVSAEQLTASVGAINDKLYGRKEVVQELARRRQGKGISEKTQREEEAEEALEKLESEVPSLTAEIEAAFRHILDRQAELQDDKAAVSAVLSQLRERHAQPHAQKEQSQRRRRGPAVDSEDEEADGDVDMEDVQVAAAIELLQKAREARAAEYEKLTVYEKYSINNDYINFRKTLHDAQHQDDSVPLPDASAWFDRDGRPALQTAREDGRTSADEDQDLVVEREVMSLKCPLTLKLMREPFSNNRCKHTFERSAILEFLARGPQKCPQTGCDQMLQKKDFFLDEIMLRKIKRAEQAARSYDGHTSDVEVDADGDASMIEAGARSIKKERSNRGKGRSQVVEEIDDE